MSKAKIATASLPLTYLQDGPEKYGLPPLPPPDMTRAYATARLLQFGRPNARKDGFRHEDVSDAVVKSLVGAPLTANADMSDHGGEIVGSVIASAKDEGGLYINIALDKEILAERFGITDSAAIGSLSVSMETRFAEDEVEYDGRPANYRVRWLKPRTFQRIALLKRGRNADPSANVLQAAASKRDKFKKSMFDFVEPPEPGVAELRELVEDLMATAAKEKLSVAEAAAQKQLQIDNRISELTRWRELSAEETKTATAVASTADELTWLTWIMGWYQSTLEHFRLEEARAAKTRTPPTLTAHSRNRLRDLFDFTDD